LSELELTEGQQELLHGTVADIDNRNELAEIDEDSMSMVMDGHKESSKQKYLHKQTP
jgi:hypothetical protein